MPIYEFACDRCRQVFQFFFRSARSRKKPRCPRCGRGGLKRRFSRFAVARPAPATSGTPEGAGGEGGDVDPARMERAMQRLEKEMASLDENDPRQMGRFMRRMMEETGQDLGPEMDVAIRRLEAGEDPEKIEEDMGDLLGDDAGGMGGMDDYGYDDTLYEA